MNAPEMTTEGRISPAFQTMKVAIGLSLTKTISVGFKLESRNMSLQRYICSCFSLAAYVKLFLEHGEGAEPQR